MCMNLIQRHSLSRDTVEIACQKDLLDSKNRTQAVRYILFLCFETTRIQGETIRTEIANA